MFSSYFLAVYEGGERCTCSSFNPASTGNCNFENTTAWRSLQVTKIHKVPPGCTAIISLCWSLSQHCCWSLC